MKKTLLIFLFFNILIFGQIDPNNRFSQSEYNAKNSQGLGKIEKGDNIGKPGNPAPILPINNQIGSLFLIGLGIIVFVAIKTKNYKFY